LARRRSHCRNGLERLASVSLNLDAITGESHVARDLTAKAFMELYRTQQQEIPPECRDSDYEKRLKAAYPIHPEVLDWLYSNWSRLVKFQRTRGSGPGVPPTPEGSASTRCHPCSIGAKSATRDRPASLA